jgi:hypothetical protein
MPTTDRLPRWRRWVLRHTPAPLLREPFLLWLALVCVLSAAAQMLGFGEPSSVQQLLPPLIRRAWHIELLVGGSLTLIGVLFSKTRLLVLGLQPLGLASLAYAFVILWLAGGRAALPAGITVAFAAACFVKAFTYSTAALGAQLPRPPLDGQP